MYFVGWCNGTPQSYDTLCVYNMPSLCNFVSRIEYSFLFWAWAHTLLEVNIQLFCWFWHIQVIKTSFSWLVLILYFALGKLPQKKIVKAIIQKCICMHVWCLHCRFIKIVIVQSHYILIWPSSFCGHLEITIFRVNLFDAYLFITNTKYNCKYT